jgi:hypothetical protein
MPVRTELCTTAFTSAHFGHVDSVRSNALLGRADVPSRVGNDVRSTHFNEPMLRKEQENRIQVGPNEAL